MSTLTFFLDAWAELDDGARVHPYEGIRGDKRGLYSVNFTNDNSKFEGVTEAQLRTMFDGGKFNERGMIRMLPLDAKRGDQRNAFAPTHYRGRKISRVASPRSQEQNSPVPALFATEVPEDQVFKEGTTTRVLVNAYERSEAARSACLAHHGYSCSVCSFNFERRYGSIGRNFIHVHHLVRLADIKSEYVINPILDLAPVCPNCHAMLHQEDPPLSPAALRVRLGEA